MRFRTLPLALALIAACDTSDDQVPDDTDLIDDTDDPVVEETDVEDTAGETDVEETDVEETDVEETDETDETDEEELDANGCRGQWAPKDRERAVVVAMPYNADYSKSNAWQVLTLSDAGDLAFTQTTFELGRGVHGTVQFSADGTLGIVAQEGGTIGIFTLDANHNPTVVEANWNGGQATAEFYAHDVVLDPGGERAWVIDGNWPNNGGGIYEIALDCVTGAPTFVGKLLSAKMPKGLEILPNDRAVIAATELDGSAPGEAYMVDGWPAAPVVQQGEDLFDYEMFVISTTALTADNKFLLVGDNSAFSGVAQRVSYAAVDGALPVKGSEIGMPDPVDIVTSPFNDAVLVTSGYEDALYVFGYDPNALGDPFTMVGEPAYAGNAPALPSHMAMVSRGALTGHVLISENQAVRQVRFDGNGGVQDLGAFILGDGIEFIPGAVGVQP